MNDEEKRVYARDLKENPLLQPLLDDMRSKNTEDWKAAHDPQIREKCWFFNQAIDDFIVRINNILSSTLEKE